MKVMHNRRRPVIDTLLGHVMARDLHYKRATQDIFDSVLFVKKGILKYLEIEDEYLVEFEALEMDSHEVSIMVSVPDEGVDLERGERYAKLWTFTLPLEVLSSHDEDLVSRYIDDMTQFETENLDLLTVEDIDQLLDNHDTVNVKSVKRRMIH